MVAAVMDDNGTGEEDVDDGMSEVETGKGSP